MAAHDVGHSVEQEEFAGTDETERTFTYKEVAELCGVTLRTVYSWLKDFDLPAGKKPERKFGQAGRQVPAHVLLAIAKARGIQPLITMLEPGTVAEQSFTMEQVAELCEFFTYNFPYSARR